jgi:hypothetical protein
MDAEQQRGATTCALSPASALHSFFFLIVRPAHEIERGRRTKEKKKGSGGAMRKHLHFFLQDPGLTK